MPTQKQVWDAADRVLTSGERVSQARVIASLRVWERGGSERVVGPYLRDWKVARNYKPRVKVEGPSEKLQGELARFAQGVWDASIAEAQARLLDERELVRVEREANDALRDEAWVEARAMEAENAGLRTRAAELEGEVEALRGEVRRLRAVEFWDRVMREVAEILPPTGGLSAKDLVRRLPPTLAAEANVLGQPLTPGRINRKMAVRLAHLKYFERDLGTGLYCRRA